MQQHVDEGRRKFNVSVPGFGEGAEDAAETVQKGSMPLASYLPMHPEARLSDAEKQQLIAGLQKTFGGEGGSEGDAQSTSPNQEKSGTETSELGETDGD